MQFIRCDHCGVEVTPTTEGHCPSCRQRIECLTFGVFPHPDLFIIEEIHFDPDGKTVTLPTDDKPANFERVKQVSRMNGTFDSRNPLNIPGPFYGAKTDTCEMGPAQAPHNVMLDTDHQEFIYKQPTNCHEVQDVIMAATCDPWGGYNADGGDHWNLTLIREWWSTRDEILEWISQELKSWSKIQDLDGWQQDQIAALKVYQCNLKGWIERYLRFYSFYLLERRLPREGESLPAVN